MGVAERAEGRAAGDGGELAAQVARRALDAMKGGFLRSEEISLRRDASGLWLHLAGEEAPVRVTSVRPAFPLSLGPEMLVFYGRREVGTVAPGPSAEAPEADVELGILRSLADLPPEGQDLLAAEIEKAYFVPRILRIHSIEERFGIQRWEVTTDRGRRAFELTERSHLRPFDNARLVVKDVDGNRYLIEDARLLDRRSQQWLDLQL